MWIVALKDRLNGEHGGGAGLMAGHLVILSLFQTQKFYDSAFAISTSGKHLQGEKILAASFPIKDKKPAYAVQVTL